MQKCDVLLCYAMLKIAVLNKVFEINNLRNSNGAKNATNIPNLCVLRLFSTYR